jgi:hypothetical protein
VSTLTVGGQALTLLPEKAAFLAESRTLLVADVHIGKAVSFRSFGVPVPRGTTGETLSALSALGRPTRRAPDRRPRRLPALASSARAGDDGRARALARRTMRRSICCSVRAITMRGPATHRCASASRWSTSHLRSTACGSAIIRDR